MAWLVTMALLVILELQDAGAVWVTAAELPMLGLTIAWFFLAVACVPPIDLHPIR